MAQSDGAAVDVDLAHVEVQLTRDGDGLRGEGFVGLNEVDVVDGHAGLGHGLTGGGNGTDAHDLGIDAALAPADELRHGLEVILLDGLAGGENDGGSAVVDAGGVGGGDPLDVLVLCSECIRPLSLVECYPIGVITMEDGGSLDEKIIAIPFQDPTYNTYQDISELPDHVASEIKHFFRVYKSLEGKETVVSDVLGRDEAVKIIIKCQNAYIEKYCR